MQGRLQREYLQLLGATLAALAAWSCWAQSVPSFRRPDDYPRYSALGSVYVPIESWVYPAIERLAARHYIDSDFRGMRPWTRTECARLVDEAGEAIARARESDRPPSATVLQLYDALLREFRPELEAFGGGGTRTFEVESVYARAMSLSGPVLNDSYHFGQTVSNDYGRPFRRGTNVVAGMSLRATAGPLFAYARGEYQHAPRAPALSESVRELIARQDQKPVKPAIPFAEVNRARLLDTYVGVNFKNWELSFGRQTLWWGTSESGPMLFSNNAEPINLFRVNRIVPFRLPSVLGVFGPMRIDFVLGRLGGHEVHAHPWVQGQRISFKMTRNFEYGATHVAMFAGEGRPGGLSTFWRTLLPFGELRRELAGGESLSKQWMSWDFQYRFLSALTLYTEFAATDEREPFNTLTRTTVNAGLYFPRLPGTEKWDLRLEGVYTNSPYNGPEKPAKASYMYWHFIYRDGYTNNGFVIGNSIGRAGDGVHGWLTYAASASERLQFHFARTVLSKTLVPGRANWTDGEVRYERAFANGFYTRSRFQLERLNFPALFPGRRSNVTVSIELGYWPAWAGRR